MKMVVKVHKATRLLSWIFIFLIEVWTVNIFFDVSEMYLGYFRWISIFLFINLFLYMFFRSLKEIRYTDDILFIQLVVFPFIKWEIPMSKIKSMKLIMSKSPKQLESNYKIFLFSGEKYNFVIYMGFNKKKALNKFIDKFNEVNSDLYK